MEASTEFVHLPQQLSSDEKSALKENMRAMLQAQEKEKYKSLQATPTEIIQINRSSGGVSILHCAFARELLTAYEAHIHEMDAASKAMWRAALLLEAGCIIGIRQERTRRRGRKHERA